VFFIHVLILFEEVFFSAVLFRTVVIWSVKKGIGEKIKAGLKKGKA
jgi:hypothetical protein